MKNENRTQSRVRMIILTSLLVIISQTIIVKKIVGSVPAEENIKSPFFSNTQANKVNTQSYIPYIIGINGKAFAVQERELQAKLIPISTSLPVFKVFGLSIDRKLLLYSPLTNGNPSGELYIEDLQAGQSKKISSLLVLEASWSPTNPNEIAYTFSGGNRFGLATIDIGSGEEKVLVSENVLADFLQWDEAGKGIHYFQTSDENQTVVLNAQFVSTETRLVNEPSLQNIPIGFPALDQSIMPELSLRAVSAGKKLTSEGIYPFRILTLDGSREILGENLLGNGLIYTRPAGSESPEVLGEGRVLKMLNDGLIIRTFTGGESGIDYIGWNGKVTSLALPTVMNYNLPLSTFTLTQGGANYPSPGNCSISSHTSSSSSAFAYDMQKSTVGAHILASADGLVVYTYSAVTCNSSDTSGCLDYVPNCAANNGGWGNVVIIQHSDGTFTKYAHMQANSIQVAVNNSACQGLYIGRQGHTGNTCCSFNGCGDHLHFQRQTTSALSGPSTAVSFSDASNPLACFSSYTSASTELSTCSGQTNPVVTYFRINNDASSTTSRNVTLNNSASGNPTQYQASESSSFSNASWLTYSSTPSFALSAGNGTKTVYFRIRNSAGTISSIVSDSIQLNETTGCTGDFGEPNNSFGSAYSVSCGTTYQAKICSSTDLDYYRVVPSSSGTMTVTMTPPADKDYDLFIYNASQQLLKSSEFGTGTQERCDVTVSGGQTYYIKVIGYQGAFSITSYSFGITCPTGGSIPGTFTLTLTSECSGTNPQIRLNWTTSSGAQSYDIYRNGSLYSSGITGTQFINTTVAAGTSYSYFVRARNSAGTRDSNTSSATAPSSCGGLPSASLQIIFSPNPVYRSSDGFWYYTVTVRELNGVGVNLTSLIVDGGNYSAYIGQWFGTTRIGPRGSISGSFQINCSSCALPYIQTWQFTGNDDNQHNGRVWSNNITLR